MKTLGRVFMALLRLTLIAALSWTSFGTALADPVLSAKNAHEVVVPFELDTD